MSARRGNNAGNVCLNLACKGKELKATLIRNGDSFVGVEVRERVAMLTLDRPPVNAMSRALVAELSAALERCSRDGAVSVAVLASASARAFSAGADIEELWSLAPEEAVQFAIQGQRLCQQVESLSMPVVCAVRGIALGGGCELAMACDLRIAGESASFGQPEVNLGLIPGWGSTQRLPRLVGKAAALELMLTGRPIPAARALALGLLNRVTADERVLDEARSTAEALAGKPAQALALIKRAVHQGMAGPMREGMALEADLFSRARATQDAQEGILAFLEKRKPRFQGR